MTEAPTPAERVRAERLAVEAREDRALARRRWGGTLALGGGALAAGLALLALSFAVDDPGWGGIAFWGGIAVGNAGMLLALYLHWRDAD